mgnify:CR=1 FL=1
MDTKPIPEENLRIPVAGFLNRLVKPERSGCQVRIVLKQRIILFLIVFSLFWFFYDLNKVALMTFIILLGVFLGCYVWARQLALKVTVKRRLLSTAVQVGDELEEEIEFENRFLLPAVWLEFNDRSNIPGHRTSGVNAADGLSTSRWQLRTMCSRRGVFLYGVWDVLMADPLGLFQVQQSYSQPEQVLVYPPLADLPVSTIPISKTQGDIRSLNQVIMANTISAMTTRPYQPGDSLRNIHWRTSAKRDSLYVKVFSPEAYSTLWLLPDIYAANHCGEGEDSTLEKTLMLAATLAYHFLNDRLSVGMLLFGEPLEILSPQRGSAYFWHILQALASVQLAEAPDLKEALRRTRRVMANRDTLLLITPARETSWLGEIASFSHRGNLSSVSVILLDSAPSDMLSSLQPVVSMLMEQNSYGLVLHADQIKPRLGSFGALRRWEFVTFGTGQVYTRQRPRRVSEMVARQVKPGSG